MRRRFFVERFEAGRAVLGGDSATHLSRVLRVEPGQLYELSDGESVWLGRVERVRRDVIEFSLVEAIPAKQPRLHTVLLLSIIKFDRFEWCLEKATELGVAEVVPLAAARSTMALVDAAAKRARRWEKILFESAQQSRRLRPPILHQMDRAAHTFAIVGPQHDVRVLLSERPDATPLRTVLSGKTAAFAALAIGPEGGWTDEELGAAHAAGFLEASLGSNILRTETAVIATLAMFNYALGD